MKSQSSIMARVFRCVIIAAICFVALPFALSFLRIWSFDHIEQHAKKVITGTELQVLAAQIVAEHPVSESENVPLILRNSELKTPLPTSLLGLYHNPPDIFVYASTTNSPGHIMLVWGGGMIGHCGFEIGPTNFISYRDTHKWQDGVYFWSGP